MNNEVFISRIEVARQDVINLIGRMDSRRGLGADEENHIVVGVNCYLGRHRSVTFVEELGRRVKEDLGIGSSWEVRVRHRELEKRA
jgi:RNase adaptor protein for sRNA GlmZ degradation